MIELKNISKTYRMGDVDVRALKDVSLSISEGEFVAIMGASGSGKSTLLHILGFLDTPDSGSYSLGGKEISKLSDDELALVRNKLAGFVFQQFYLLPSENALQNARLPLVYAGGQSRSDIAKEKLEIVGLGKRVHHHPNQMSGGEQQRVAIARSLVNDPLFIFADEPTGNLDTKSEAEIVEILKKLNDDGKTIVMVTHENEIAAHAKRIIKMRDGEIIDDTVREKTAKKAADKTDRISIHAIISGRHLAVARAEFSDHLKQAFHSVISHKVRSVLSILGILIGVASVIAMLALGRGAAESIKQGLSSLGSNLLMIHPGSHRMHGVASEQGAVSRFSLKDVEAIARLTDKVKRVSASVNGSGQVVYGNKNWRTTVMGTHPEYAEMHAYEPKIGKFFGKEEVQRQDKVAVIGYTIIRELFGEKNPVGSTIKINRVNFRVIGLLPEKGSSGWRDMDDMIIIPITTAMNRLLGKEYVDSIDAEVRDVSLMDAAEQSLRQLINSRKKLTEEESEDAYEIMNMQELQQAVQTTTRTMTMLLGSIAGISLLVGGIGIMNIMLVAVKERTKEIGLRKAIGARSSDIMTQFLIESVVMTMLGGLIGILLGVSIAYLISAVANWSTYVSISSIILSVGFSIIVGVTFGMWPAYQAAKLRPIEALRYE